MKTGEKIRICDMSDRHLLFTIRMLERYSHAKRDAVVSETLRLPAPNGEMAEELFDNECDRIFESVPDDYLPPIFEKLQAEQLRRGLERLPV